MKENINWEIPKEADNNCWKVTTETEVHYVHARDIRHNHGSICFLIKSGVVASYSPTGYISAIKVDPITKTSMAVEVNN